MERQIRRTNKEQFRVLVAYMKQNPDIAKGAYSRRYDVVVQFWNDLISHLNAEGPPYKNVAEWKKVWSDYKSFVKRKVYQKRFDKRPIRNVRFNELEVEVAKLLSLDRSETAEEICFEEMVPESSEFSEYILTSRTTTYTSITISSDENVPISDD